MNTIGDYPLSRMNAEAVRNYIDEQIEKAKAELTAHIAVMPGVVASVDNLRLGCIEQAAIINGGEQALVSDVLRDAERLYLWATGKEQADG